LRRQAALGFCSCIPTLATMMDTSYYIVDAKEIAGRAKDYLVAKINTQRAYANGVPFEEFKVYSEKNADMYIEFAKSIDCMPGFVRTPAGTMRHIRVERFNFKVVIQVPVGLEPNAVGLVKISQDVYQTMRRQAMATGMGMPFLKQRKLVYTSII